MEYKLFEEFITLKHYSKNLELHIAEELSNHFSLNILFTLMGN